jgi:CheY-like chemotaxis protein
MMDKRILILDDDHDILYIVKEALHYAGYVVKDISLGTELFYWVEHFQPHLILLDHRLADARGADLCHQLKGTAAFRHIPVVIFSAYINPGETLSADCDGYLYKPFDLLELFEMVQKLRPIEKGVSDEK